MGKTKLSISFSAALVALALSTSFLHADTIRGKKRDSDKLSISRDSVTGEISISWSGKGILKEASNLNGHLKPVQKRAGTYIIEPTEEEAAFLVQNPNGGVISVNAVGYVNLRLLPGLTLIANPLLYPTNTVSFWWPQAPDGAQVLKWVPDVGYEVSTYDAVAGMWSNPDFDISMGQGFFFRNTSSEPIIHTFVGEVLQGRLVNPLAAGLSLEGPLVPQAGSINTVHQIPGQPDDEIRLYVNDGMGGGDYINSIYTSSEGWVPDLILGVAEGFWIQKQQPEDWVRYFWVN
jgi:hypothetical protein